MKRAMQTYGRAAWQWLDGEGGVVGMITPEYLDTFTGVLIDEQRDAAGEPVGTEAAT